MAIITISRGTKSGGEKLARCLSERLGYSSLSHEVILEGAKKYNILEDELLTRLKTSPGLWRKFTMEHRRYLIFVQCALLDAVRQDNVVYHGYAGQVFLRGIQHVLKTRLDAPVEERLKIVMHEQQLDADAARNYITEIDEQRRRWIKWAYGEEWRDPALYDMTFYTGNMTIDTICELIALAVSRKEFQTTEASARRLADISTECEVKAAFASDDKLWRLPITVTANGGTVLLKGAVKDEKLRNMLVDLASQVKGVTECKSNISLLSGRLSKGIYGHN
jgi:cytidylate kinase